jgi:hypothetical protein
VGVGSGVPRSTKAHTEKAYYSFLAVKQLRSFQGFTMTNIASLVHPYDTIVTRVSAFESERETQRRARTTGDRTTRVKPTRTPGEFERGLRQAYATPWG